MQIPTVPTWTYTSCVEFAKWYLGRQGESWGWAGNIQPTVDTPYVGGLVLTREGSGHIGVIIAIRRGLIDIVEANYVPGQKTHRTQEIDNPLIRGFK